MKAQMMGAKAYLIIFGIILLALGGAGIASSMGMIDLPIALPGSLFGFPALYVFGGLLGLGVILLIASSRMM